MSKDLKSTDGADLQRLHDMLKESDAQWNRARPAAGLPESSIALESMAHLEQQYREGDPTALLHAVHASWLADVTVPSWAHKALAEIAHRFLALDGDLDLQRALGGKGKEGQSSVMKRRRTSDAQYRLGMEVAEALGANARLFHRRRKSTQSVYRSLTRKTGKSERTLSRALKKTGYSERDFAVDPSKRGLLWGLRL